MKDNKLLNGFRMKKFLLEYNFFTLFVFCLYPYVDKME